MHYQGNQQRKTRKKVVLSAISFKIHYSYFAIEIQTSSIMLRFQFGNMQLDQFYLISESREVLLYDKKKKKKKHLKRSGRKLKLVHVQCGTNVLTYPWAKIVDNLVANYANCGSQGSPIHKTSYIRS